MTAVTEQQVRIVAKLYEARKAAKFLLGDKYAEEMRKVGQVLTQLAESRKTTVLAVAGTVAQSLTNPYEQLQVLAAAVELVEPSA